MPEWRESERGCCLQLEETPEIPRSQIVRGLGDLRKVS